MTVLVTGAGGFVGAHVTRAVAAAGHAARALVRPGRPAPDPATDLEVVRGDVTSPADCDRAAAGCAAVIHVAGLIKARDEAGFARVNVFGARVMAEAADQAGARRFVLVSSLAARGPAGSPGPVSAYGRSKRAGEEAVRDALDGRVDLVVVRPTAVYGPGDQALLPLFRLASLGFRPVQVGAGPLTFIHARDLARALARIATDERTAPLSEPLEAADGATYAWDEVSRLLARAVGRPGAPHRVPSTVFAAAARAMDLVALVSGVPQVFGRDKLADMRGDWSAAPEAFWRAAGDAVPAPCPLAEGFTETADAYRTARLLGD